jgi:hypothetical protein
LIASAAATPSAPTTTAPRAGRYDARDVDADAIECQPVAASFDEDYQREQQTLAIQSPMLVMKAAVHTMRNAGTVSGCQGAAIGKAAWGLD